MGLYYYLFFRSLDKWRSHPIITINGWKDFNHILPGFGIAVGLIFGYLTIKTVGGGGHHHTDWGHQFRHKGGVFLKDGEEPNYNPDNLKEGKPHHGHGHGHGHGHHAHH
eukprot:TRINITY_DN44210_c1_g1_i1.p1 TRINITY_DN44210_c1_g1~~TRINITY_DN44210_c1_g1_i1.p1  ORF type:complete len:109 (+),score=9.72 TRINITY_DN44210_c1_g1_i1:187-513(+)